MTFIAVASGTFKGDAASAAFKVPKLMLVTHFPAGSIVSGLKLFNFPEQELNRGPPASEESD